MPLSEQAPAGVPAKSVAAAWSIYVIGLTGNIATGKSTVARLLGGLGAQVLDLDTLAHSAMRPDSEVHRAIMARFGPEMVQQDGVIDRGRLGALVFADAVALQDLEQIVHPVVIAETVRWLAELASEPSQPGRGPTERAVCVIEAIKLVEAGLRRYCDALWVVTARREQQVERLVLGRGFTVAQAKARVDAQAPQEGKVALADVVIDNSRTRAVTRAQVLRAWAAIPGTQPGRAKSTPTTTKPERSSGM